MAQDWPGNVRELRNAVDRFCLGVAVAEARDTDAGASLAQRMDRFERQFIEEALRRCHGSVSAAAEHLQMPRKTLYDKLQRHQLFPDDYRGEQSRPGAPAQKVFTTERKQEWPIPTSSPAKVVDTPTTPEVFGVKR